MLIEVIGYNHSEVGKMGTMKILYRASIPENKFNFLTRQAMGDALLLAANKHKNNFQRIEISIIDEVE